MSDNIVSTTNLLRGFIAILALFPGMAVYAALADVPADFVGTARILSFSLCVTVLIVIAAFSETICAIGKRRIAVYALIAVLLGGGSLMFYRQFAKDHIIEAPVDGRMEPFMIPLRPSDRVSRTVARQDAPTPQEGYIRAIEQSDPGGPFVVELRASWDSFLAMVALLMLSQILLVAPPVAASWRLTAPARGRTDAQAASPGGDAAGSTGAGGDPPIPPSVAV